MTTIVVRRADQQDISSVTALTSSARVLSPSGAALDPATQEALGTHFSVYLAAGGSLFVAQQQASSHNPREIIGFIMFRTVEPFLFAQHRSVVVDTFYVRTDMRRRGVGHRLMEQAALVAEHSQSPWVYAAVPSGDRGMQRFLAQLGFAPSAGYRVASTETLARCLGTEAQTSRREHKGRAARMRQAQSRGSQATGQIKRSSIEELIARRRKARESGTATGAMDLSSLRSTTAPTPVVPAQSLTPGHEGNEGHN